MKISPANDLGSNDLTQLLNLSFQSIHCRNQDDLEALILSLKNLFYFEYAVCAQGNAIELIEAKGIPRLDVFDIQAKQEHATKEGYMNKHHPLSETDSSRSQVCACCGIRFRLLTPIFGLPPISARSLAQQHAYQCANCGQMVCFECSKNVFRCLCKTDTWIARLVFIRKRRAPVHRLVGNCGASSGPPYGASGNRTWNLSITQAPPSM